MVDVSLISRWAHLSWQVVFYAFSLFLLIAIAFWVIESYQLTPAFTTDNYTELLATPRYRYAIINSLRLSLLAALMAVALALAVAYALAFYVRPKIRQFFFIALLGPFF